MGANELTTGLIVNLPRNYIHVQSSLHKFHPARHVPILNQFDKQKVKQEGYFGRIESI